MRLLPIIGIISLASVLASCASVGTQREALAAPATPCCGAIAASPAVALTASGVKIQVADSDPIAAFSTGNSHYRVLDLGAVHPARIAVRPVWQMTNVYTGGGSWGPVFFASVTFLSADRQVLSTVAGNGAPDRITDCGKDHNCGIGAATFAVPEGARYAVIHTAQDLVGATRSTQVPGNSIGQTMMVGKSFVTVGAGQPVMIRTIGMSTGQVEVVPAN